MEDISTDETEEHTTVRKSPKNEKEAEPKVAPVLSLDPPIEKIIAAQLGHFGGG